MFVTGAELIPLFEIGFKIFEAFSFILGKLEKGKTSEFRSKLENIQSILELFERLNRDMKQGEGASTTEPGVPEVLKVLMPIVENGKRLVHGCLASGSSKIKKKYRRELEGWEESFKTTLLAAIFVVLVNLWSNVNETKQNRSSKENRCCLSPQRQHRLSLMKEEDNEKRGPDIDKKFDPLQGVTLVSPGEDANKPKPSVPQLTKGDGKKKITSRNIAAPSKSTTNVATPCQSEIEKINTAPRNSAAEVAAHCQIHPESVENQAVKIKKPEEEIKEVCFRIVGRCESSEDKKNVEKAREKVPGVRSAWVVIRENQEKDFVMAKVTKKFDPEVMKRYLKKNLHRKSVSF